MCVLQAIRVNVYLCIAAIRVNVYVCIAAIREDRTRGGRSTYQCGAPYTLPPSLVGAPPTGGGTGSHHHQDYSTSNGPGLPSNPSSSSSNGGGGSGHMASGAAGFSSPHHHHHHHRVKTEPIDEDSKPSCIDRPQVPILLQVSMKIVNRPVSMTCTVYAYVSRYVKHCVV